MAKVAYTVGRFQPPTIGHELLIRKVMSVGAPAFVFVSQVTTPADENPLTSAQKVEALRSMFPSGVTFVDTANCDPKCGGPVAANDYLRKLGYTNITLVAGSDRAKTFGPNADMWKKGNDAGIPPPAFLPLERTEGSGATGMSGTKARAFARTGKYEEFAAAVKVGTITSDATKALYDAIRARTGGGRLRGGLNEEALIDEDDEPPGKAGRRKTRRVKRSKASGKALYRRGSQSRNGSSKTNRSSYALRGYSKGSSTW